MTGALKLPNRHQVISNIKKRLDDALLATRVGYVTEIVINTVKASVPDPIRGELCRIEKLDGSVILAEITAFDQQSATLSCLQAVNGISIGARVIPLGIPHSISTRLGSYDEVLDGLGRSLNHPDDWTRGVLSLSKQATSVVKDSTLATQRPPIEEALETGVRIIDHVLTVGKGQRIGIFAPPGCGKSTTMAQIVRGAKVDAVVFGLVGERGRELNEFMTKEIDDDIRRKSYFVCATSDRTPIERVRCALTATAIAEHLRDQGKSVLLLIDSITRLARAQRELGLMAGEPATQSGYTPSVYTALPELIERAGRSERGDITAIYTVLLDGETIEDDPIASEAKSLLDGHIVLTTKLVEKAHFPAISPLKSLSRVMSSVVDKEAVRRANLVRRAYSLYEEVELLIRLNEYQKGNDPLIDEAVRIKPMLDEWCKQDRFLCESKKASQESLDEILEHFQDLVE